MLRTTPALSSERSSLQKVLFLVLLFTSVLFLPYLVTPPVTISRSYVAGFSNRTAIVLFLLGSTFFAFFTKGTVSRTEDRDSRLPRWTLIAGVVVTWLVCLCRFRLKPLPPGVEWVYFLNRQQLLAAGLKPYRQFEFAYGPLLLYPGLWAQKLLHTSALSGYVFVWVLESILGAAMVWVVVRILDFPISSRVLVFSFLLLSQLVWVDRAGLSYTAFRSYSAALGIALTYAVWKRTHNCWWMALCSVLAVGLSMACSVDQAIGVAFGLNAYMLLLSVNRISKFHPGALLLSLAGSVAAFDAAERSGMLITLKSFGSGGYSYPLLPSPSVLLALFAYIVAGCVFFRTVARRRFDSVVIPLTLGGIAMLPAALGRCDILHITAATPLFVVGVASIASMPVVRVWWLTLAFFALVVLPPALSRRDAFFAGVVHAVPSWQTWAVYEEGRFDRMQNQNYVSSVDPKATLLPCDQTYFSPSFMPSPEKPFHQCLDTGYFLGFTNVITPETIEDKLQEMRQHSSQPLLLQTIPIEEQIPLQLATLDSLHIESGSFWVPPRRHAPLTYAPIIDYIRSHYDPGPYVAKGKVRVWTPKAGEQQ